MKTNTAMMEVAQFWANVDQVVAEATHNAALKRGIRILPADPVPEPELWYVNGNRQPQAEDFAK